VFRGLVDNVAVPLLERFSPQLVLVSAGYDAHHEDPLGGCEVTEGGYTAMTRSLRAAAASAGAALGFVLEGGYALGALARSVAATMRELTSIGPADPDPAPTPPMGRAAHERLAPWWPGLRAPL
jgi:acetoin utilization deacetylase AcuC-like enzyme